MTNTSTTLKPITKLPKPVPTVPAEHWFLKNAQSFRKNQMAFIMKAHDDYGTVVDINLPTKSIISIIDPDDIKHVLVGNNRNYVKDEYTRGLSLALGNGLLTSEGDFWRRQRRIAQPAFRKHRLQRLADTMISATEEMLESWDQKSTSFNLSDEMLVLTSNIATRTLFGVSIENNLEIGNSILFGMRFLVKRFRSIVKLPVWIPTPLNIKFNRAMRLQDRAIYEIIEDRKKSNTEHHDLLAMLMEAEDEETGEKMTPKQLRDECLTLFSAGHETSANALTWTFYLLDQNPEVLEKLIREIDEVLGGRMPSAADIRNLGYTHQVIQEAMRLYPPAWIIGREALEEDEIKGYRIPKKAMVTMCTFALHRRNTLWENPEIFDPDRFTPNRIKARHKYAYIPFGGGPRLCIGTHFAMMEMQLALAMILQKFFIKVVPDQEIKLEPLITLRPYNGIQVTLEKRK